jgi:hypothetical protein
VIERDPTREAEAPLLRIMQHERCGHNFTLLPARSSEISDWVVRMGRGRKETAGKEKQAQAPSTSGGARDSLTLPHAIRRDILI